MIRGSHLDLSKKKNILLVLKELREYFKSVAWFSSFVSDLFCPGLTLSRVGLLSSPLRLLNIPRPSCVLLHLSELAILAEYRGKPVKDSTSSGSGLFYLTLSPAWLAHAHMVAQDCYLHSSQFPGPGPESSGIGGACLVTIRALIPHLVPDFGTEFPSQETWTTNIHTLICWSSLKSCRHRPVKISRNLYNHSF